MGRRARPGRRRSVGNAFLTTQRDYGQHRSVGEVINVFFLLEIRWLWFSVQLKNTLKGPVAV